ncbi:hypothetical protein [Brachybacterium sp. YJGR34]|uniref:hypothetical protein n=1 Tax=Brachybacterium sp. YJGR34 TaxID=2059911 RepID=UPI000E0C6537|nr:hypothetical protein [Brachybacterium sp. YJGR34]
MEDQERSADTPRDRDTRQRWQREREEVLSEYGTWRLTGEQDAPASAEVQTLETLLRLKAERLDSPDVGLWSEELTEELLTRTVPRTVIQPREQVMDMVPTLGRFFRHLRETGRWREESMAPDDVPRILRELEFAALEAADDPTRRSFSTNILGYGLSLGVELEDDDELAAFMHWYNALPDEERVALSETGRLAEPSRPYDRDREMREVADADGSGRPWPWFLPAPEEGADPLREVDLDLDEQSYRANGFVRSAATVLEFVGEERQGRRLTATGALRRHDVRELLGRMGTETEVHSMWDHPELTGPWVTLLDGGWIEQDGGVIRRAEGPVPYARAAQDPEGFVEFGHAVLTALLFGKDARDREDGGFRGMPDTLAAMLEVCRPGGLTLTRPVAEGDERDGPRIPLDERTGQPDHLELARWVHVAADLDDLVGSGAIRRQGDHYEGSPVMMVALVSLLKERGPSGPTILS